MTIKTKSRLEMISSRSNLRLDCPCILDVLLELQGGELWIYCFILFLMEGNYVVGNSSICLAAGLVNHDMDEIKSREECRGKVDIVLGTIRNNLLLD